jgi:hypothetical protein
VTIKSISEKPPATFGTTTNLKTPNIEQGAGGEARYHHAVEIY